MGEFDGWAEGVAMSPEDMSQDNVYTRFEATLKLLPVSGGGGECAVVEVGGCLNGGGVAKPGFWCRDALGCPFGLRMIAPAVVSFGGCSHFGEFLCGELFKTLQISFFPGTCVLILFVLR